MQEEIDLREEHTIIGNILAKYPLLEDLTQEEWRLWTAWYADDRNKTIVETIMQEKATDLERMVQIKERMHEGREKYYEAIEESRSSGAGWWSNWKTYMAAASILVIASLAYLGYNKKAQTTIISETPVVVKSNDVEPGKFTAKLTLADGSVLIVDSLSSGQLVQQGSTTVYNKDGKLVYQKQGKQKDEVLYNTLTTANGQTYATVLSDGSKVWLNSQSSIKYPVSFIGRIRQVEITGEAYFEVAHDANKPFHVLAEGMEIQVVGTHFNVNGYRDEAILKTTLLEGKVKISKGNYSTVLTEGQQAQLNKQTQTIEKLNNVDVDEAVAWRFGYFQFNDADLQTVLRQLVRWYDVEVIYQGPIPQREFWGKISRKNTLSQVLRTLETNNIHFKQEGKRIIVSP